MDSFEYLKSFRAGKDDEGRRLDRLIRKMFPELPLSWIYSSIRKGYIRQNQKKAHPASKIKMGDEINIKSNFPLPSPSNRGEETSMTLLKTVSGGGARLKYDLKSMILFENEHVLVLNKPRGLLVHGRESLDTLVRAYIPMNQEKSLSFKPGPVHRLDRNTSGIVLFSLSLAGARILSTFIKEGRAEKYYAALFSGRIKKKETWNDYLIRDPVKKVSLGISTSRDACIRKGKIAESIVFPLISTDKSTLAFCRLITGRTHQIRIQGALHGHPLVGDRKYGGPALLNQYILHAFCFRLKTSNSLIGFHQLFAPIPDKSISYLNSLLGKIDVEKALNKLQNECCDADVILTKTS